MRRKLNQQKLYYFSDRLKRQLAQISGHPLTVVEAPSGFGKTTAVREYFRENLPAGAGEYWYTCLGEPATIAWQGICELLANANEEVAAGLKKLEMPTIDTLMYLAAIFRNLRCETETYLIIDNYQLLRSDIPGELMSVFSMHESSALHIVFITQQLGVRQKAALRSANVHTIDSSSFFFDREGILNLFRMEGIRLSQSELESVYLSTEGWVAAIRLQIINYEENGSFDRTIGVEHLVENAIWNRLEPQEKDFLLAVSILDSFTARQGAIMLSQEVLPANIEELLSYSDFIRYFPDKGIYIIHGILQNYLQNRFYYHQSQDFQNRIFRLAGQSFAATSQYFPAAQFFYKVRDFDAIFSLPFNGEYLSNQKEKHLLSFVAGLVSECPEETLLKYPFAMLTFSYQMFIGGRFDTYAKLCSLIGRLIENSADLDQEELRMIQGEYMLMASYRHYNDIRLMGEGYRKAWETLNKPSVMFKYDFPWTFGCPSVLFMFWRESGQLENEIRSLEECLPIYRKLTQNHGAGAASVMRAEALLMRGEDDQAEIYCHKALYEARGHQQACTGLCAELVLARIAAMRGDPEGYFAAVRNIQNYARDNSNLYVLRMVDLCMTVLSLMLGVTDHVAKWIYDMESIRKIVYSPVIPYAQTLYSMLLLIEKRNNEFLGISQMIMEAASVPAEGTHYLMAQVYHYIYLAVAKLVGGNDRAAQEYLQKALAIALPDKIYLPFITHVSMLESYLESAKNALADREGISAVIALGKRQERGIAAIKKAIFQAKSPLTAREREIALLARDRLSAKEIADKLYIAEATVKTILKSIYGKLDIHSKSELNFKEF
jgi:LuxR family maltose regulon positive regulatory protein